MQVEERITDGVKGWVIGVQLMVNKDQVVR